MLDVGEPASGDGGETVRSPEDKDGKLGGKSIPQLGVTAIAIAGLVLLLALMCPKKQEEEEVLGSGFAIYQYERDDRGCMLLRPSTVLGDEPSTCISPRPHYLLL